MICARQSSVWRQFNAFSFFEEIATSVNTFLSVGRGTEDTDGVVREESAEPIEELTPFHVTFNLCGNIRSSPLRQANRIGQTRVQSADSK